MTKKEAVQMWVNRALQAVPQEWARIVCDSRGEYPRFGMWGTVFIVDCPARFNTRRMEHDTMELRQEVEDTWENGEEKERILKAIDENDYSKLEEYIDEEMAGELCILDKDGNTTAAFLHETEDCDFISINGAGWNFYDGVWDRLYDALGLQWHDEETSI